MGIGFAEGELSIRQIPTVFIIRNSVDLLVCVALGVDMVHTGV